MLLKEAKFYMDTAIRLSELSYANRSKVGCLLVRDRRIISFGYNGTPPNWDNHCETPENVTRPEVIHAEENCLSKLTTSTDTSVGSILFITLEPCIHCAKLLYLGKIQRVIYKDDYQGGHDGTMFLRRCGIQVTQYDKYLEEF